MIIAFDVDNTLIKEDTPNHTVVSILMLLSQLKNVEIVVWSGGGKDYAERWVRKLGISNYVNRCASKTEKISPDIAFDDIETCTLGKINLIV